MNVRECTENIEKQTLSKYASLSQNSKGRAKEDNPCQFRTAYQRDRDRIIHCKSFRRLKQKTQVFLSPEGDHYRTRLTHTLEVSQIARTIARSLRLNEDLAEAIALGHDLGHTPFGHAGERALNTIAPDGFAHYKQSVRVVELIEKYPAGLNLSWEVLNGIACHTKGNEAATLEGQVVKYADHIAYINHDIEDAITAGVLLEKDLPKEITDILGNTKSQRITTLITSLVENSGEKIKMADEIFEQYENLHTFMYETVYVDKTAKKEEVKVEKIIFWLYEHFMQNIDQLPEQYKLIEKEQGTSRAVVDYISGMSDEFAIHTFERVFVPKSWNIY